ncbi:MAG: VWA domain-containing protein [Anaerolineae bacterium]|nr:VWA domain-containing protein [Anaerolineae bacterium]
MQFLSPASLWLLALALPIIAVYLLRLHRREMPVASILLWQAAAADHHANRPWQKLRRHWLLLLQLLILVVLALTAARPALPTSMTSQGQVLVLLDASASMQARRVDGRTRFEAALAELRSLADALEPAARVTLIEVSAAPQVLLRDGEGAALRRALPGLLPTDGIADWRAAAELAAGLAAGKDSTTLLLTDSAVSQTLPALPGMAQLISVGDASANVGLVDFSLRRSAEMFTAFIRVKNAGPARTVVLLLLGEDEVFDRRVLNLSDEGELTLSISDLPARRWFEVRLEETGDGFVLDDRAWVTLPASGSGRVLLVTPGNRFLNLALRALPGIQVVQATTLSQDVAGVGVVVLDQITSTVTLKGNAWLIAPGAITPCGEPVGVFTLTATLSPISNPLLQYVSWDDVHIARATRYRMPADALTLLETQEGPLLWTLNRPGQRIICQAFALQDSDLPLRVAFPILSNNLMGWLLPQISENPIFPLPAGQAWIPSVPLGTIAASLLTPDGQRMDLSGSVYSSMHSPIPRLAGLYRLELETETGTETHYTALALLDAAESDLRARSVAVEGQTYLGDGAATGWRDLSRWIIVVALVLLCVEAVLWWGRDGLVHNKNLRLGIWSYEWRSVLLRLGLLSILGLALVDVRIVQSTRDLVTVFVVDRSASVEAHRQEIDALLSTAWESKGARDRAGIVAFGDDVWVEQSLTEGALIPQTTVTPRRDATDIAAAVRLGASLIPEGAPGRLVLITDGLETRGDGAVALSKAHDLGIETLVAGVGQNALSPEVWVEALRLPARAIPEDTVTVNVILGATVAQPVQLVWSVGEQVGEATWQVAAGESSYLVSFTAPNVGLTPVRFCVLAEQDHHLENNCSGGWLRVEGAPQILVVGTLEERAPLAAALSQTNLEIIQRLPGEMPLSAQTLSGYAAVVLVNTPVRALPLQAATSLHTYVRDLGGGLVAIGGPESYGVGGWSSTDLETALPVIMQVQDPRRFSPLATIIVIDKSGSMAAADTGGSISKIRLAAEAASRAAEALNDDDMLAVVAYDDRPADTFGPVSGRDRELLIERLLSLQAGGGGIYVRDGLIYAEQLFESGFEPGPGQQRHVLLVADGSDAEQQAGALAQVTALRAQGVTVSVIAIGAGSDVPFLQEVAQEGQGRFYLTERAADLPAIFTEEMARVRRSYIVEQVFSPVPGIAWAPLESFTTLPSLQGYVATTPKPGAEVPLWGAVTVDPLLATWQYGLGRAVAWTSDATGRWAVDWLAWEDFPRFWGSIVRWVLPSPVDEGIALTVEAEGELAHIILDVWDAGAESPTEGLDLVLQASQLEGIAPLPATELRQTAPGRYETVLTLGDAMAPWLFRVSGQRQFTMGWVSPYATEFVPGNSAEAITRLTARGQSQPLSEPSQAFAQTLEGRRAGLPLRHLLIVFAAWLWALDVVMRRLVIGQGVAKNLICRLKRVGGIQRRGSEQHRREASGNLSPEHLDSSLTAPESSEDVALATQLRERLKKPPN